MTEEQFSERIALIQSRVQERLKALGMTERAASIKATGSPDALRYLRTRNAMPSGRRFIQIAKVLEADPSYLMGDVDHNDWDRTRDILESTDKFTESAWKASEDLHNLKRPAPTENPLVVMYTSRDRVEIEADTKDAPVLDVYMADTNRVIDFIPMPIAFSEKEADGIHCFRTQEGSMDPVFPQGSIVLYTSKLAPRVGDFVVAYLAPASDPDAARVPGFLLRRLVGFTDKHVTLERLNPETTVQYDRARLRELLRVMTYDEVVCGFGGIKAAL